eukprot:TRINITY_DN16206_c0_g1_i2.p1 TRINITY_DN16206_c0_g1~~TRINITY_DN16206_c0_g1_i2.p1  ORF type:complete len:462 (+),score=91.69 TRINITY_DN16206_c0_g1_i2:377-1762(+)
MHRYEALQRNARVEHTMVPAIARLLDAARSSGVEVMYTVIEALTADGRDASLDYKLSGPLFVPKSHPDAKVLPEIAPLQDEIILPKTSCSVFCSTNINYVLRNLGARYLIVCGQITNQCVESAVRDAADLGYLVTVPEDACAANSQAEHEAGLSNMRGFARLKSSQELMKELTSQTKPRLSRTLQVTKLRRVCLLSLCKDVYYGARVPAMVKEMFDEAAGKEWELVNFDAESGKYPSNLDAFSGFLIMGSPASAAEGAEHKPWLKQLCSFITKLWKEQRPLVGICFGHQAIACSLGGTVVINPAGTQAALKSFSLSTAARKALHLEASSTDSLELFCHHADAVVTLPRSAESWGYGRSGHWGATYGAFCLSTQTHPEFSSPTGRQVLREILEHDREHGQMDATAFAPLSAKELEREISAVNRPTDHLVVVRAFAQMLGLLEGPLEEAPLEGSKGKRLRVQA